MDSVQKISLALRDGTTKVVSASKSVMRINNGDLADAKTYVLLVPASMVNDVYVPKDSTSAHLGVRLCVAKGFNSMGRLVSRSALQEQSSTMVPVS